MSLHCVVMGGVLLASLLFSLPSEAVTQFMAGGGDGYVALREGQIEATGPLDREAFATWWASYDFDGD